MKLIDDFLNQTTMYRLILYYLIFLVGVGLFIQGINLIFSTTLLLIFCWVTNKVFAKVFNVTTNLESVYITALILALIIAPIKTAGNLPFLFWASMWAIVGKFIFAYKGKHLFNPVALGVLIPSVFLGFSANWWVGTLPMLVPVLLGGLLIVRKIRRTDMVLTFLGVAMLTILGLNFFSGTDVFSLVKKVFVESPILFFSFVMFTEPLTTPPTKTLQIIYGTLVGFLFAPQLHIGPLFTTPESTLIIGNIYSFIVSPKGRFALTLKEKDQIAPDIYDYVFESKEKIPFTPGQYMEWTLDQPHPDSRGSRRYFTLASSPTENNIRIGVKFNLPQSTYKKALAALNPGDQISVFSVAGDFVLPSDGNTKLVFIAGGIGITPFRSMLKYLQDTNQKRDIIVLYSNKLAEDAVYQDVLNTARTVYSVGRFTPEKIVQEVPDFKDRMFYLSGPHNLVTGFEETLAQMGVFKSKIKTDYFPGFV